MKHWAGTRQVAFFPEGQSLLTSFCPLRQQGHQLRSAAQNCGISGQLNKAPGPLGAEVGLLELPRGFPLIPEGRRLLGLPGSCQSLPHNCQNLPDSEPSTMLTLQTQDPESPSLPGTLFHRCELILGSLTTILQQELPSSGWMVLCSVLVTFGKMETGHRDGSLASYSNPSALSLSYHGLHIAEAGINFFVCLTPNFCIGKANMIM